MIYHIYASIAVNTKVKGKLDFSNWDIQVYSHISIIMHIITNKKRSKEICIK